MIMYQSLFTVWEILIVYTYNVSKFKYNKCIPVKYHVVCTKKGVHSFPHDTRLIDYGTICLSYTWYTEEKKFTLDYVCMDGRGTKKVVSASILDLGEVI